MSVKDSSKRGTLSDPIKNVEYLHVVNNGKPVLKFGDEINGLKKSELQEKIGDLLGKEGRVNYSLKLKNRGESYAGSIRAFTSNKEVQKSNIELDRLEQTLQELNKKIDSKSSNDNFDLILKMKDQAYEMQISFYKTRIDVLEREIEKLNKILEDSDGDGKSDLLEAFMPLIAKYLGGANAV